MRLVVFGDFNCPYSCLASARADVLVAQGRAEVDWRAVEHDPAVPVPSEPVDGKLAGVLDREVTEVRGLLNPGERFPIVRPPVHPNSGAAVAAFAATSPSGADAVRARLFAGLWFDGRDIGDAAVIHELVGEPGATGVERALRWREEWLGLERRLVPMLVLPEGDVSRGLDALARLAQLAT
jgi:predicted DsbA family dithiol-disulfide isomerase